MDDWRKAVLGRPTIPGFSTLAISKPHDFDLSSPPPKLPESIIELAFPKPAFAESVVERLPPPVGPISSSSKLKPSSEEISRRPAKKARTKSPYQWTTGGMRNITHIDLINRGGFGEVHKVSLRMVDHELTKTDEE